MKNLLEFLADVWSGRVWDTFKLIFDELRTLKGRVKEIEMTENEQKLTNAANSLLALFVTLGQIISSQKAKIDTLMAQAASDAAHQPEDLSQEFAQLDDVQAQGQAIVDSMTPAATPVAPTDPVVTPPVDVSVPVVQPDLPPATPVIPGDPSDPGPGMDPSSPAPDVPPVADPVPTPAVDTTPAPVDTTSTPQNPVDPNPVVSDTPVVDAPVEPVTPVAPVADDDTDEWGEDDPRDVEEDKTDPAPPVQPSNG